MLGCVTSTAGWSLGMTVGGHRFLRIDLAKAPIRTYAQGDNMQLFPCLSSDLDVHERFLRYYKLLYDFVGSGVCVHVCLGVIAYTGFSAPDM